MTHKPAHPEKHHDKHHEKPKKEIHHETPKAPEPSIVKEESREVIEEPVEGWGLDLNCTFRFPLKIVNPWKVEAESDLEEKLEEVLKEVHDMKEEIEKVEEEKQQIEAHNDFIKGIGILLYCQTLNVS